MIGVEIMNGVSVLGVFDSGVGGLTVLRELIGRNRYEKIIYLGDTGRVPYGTRSAEKIREYAEEDLSFLLGRGAGEIVAACGTVSSVALDSLREAHPGLHIEGVIDATVTGAARATKNGRIGVIGTAATVRSGVYQRRLGGDFRVIAQACPLFVPLTEYGFAATERGRETVLAACDYYLSPLKEAGIDTLVMGCTHFPLLEGFFNEYFDGRVALINSGRELALTVEAGNCTSPGLELFVTDDPSAFSAVAKAFSGCEDLPEPKKVKIQ